VQTDSPENNNTIHLGIPRKLGHIWIGPRKPPIEWMNTWKVHHPHWDYTLYGNEFLASYPFKNKRLIKEYLKRGEFHGVADLMRYEILYEFGGYIPGSDSICLTNTDELFSKPSAYTVYENEKVRPGLVSPILASEPKNPFVKNLIDELGTIPPHKTGEPWKTTGNRFVAQMMSQYKPDIVIFPSHFFIPEHFTGEVYKGDGKVYCRQLFGTTVGAYGRASTYEEIKMKLGKWRSKILRSLFCETRFR
jgi:mannosyltransferase OCH1-like enzyme